MTAQGIVPAEKLLHSVCLKGDRISIEYTEDNTESFDRLVHRWIGVLKSIVANTLRVSDILLDRLRVSDMARADRHLRHQGVNQTSLTPQTLPDWNPVAGGIQSLYFTDPDGHNLALIHFRGAGKRRSRSKIRLLKSSGL